jgi:hypothetical protein
MSPIFDKNAMPFTGIKPRKSLLELRLVKEKEKNLQSNQDYKKKIPNNCSSLKNMSNHKSFLEKVIC